MIIVMLSGASLMYCLFLRRTFGFARLPAFIVGGMFGFSPYFVFKTHAHVNLIGGVFWGGALATVVHAYVHNRFDWRQGALFSLCLWATFWTSFVELFALLITCSFTALVFELAALAGPKRPSGLKRIAFFGMALPGAVSLLSLRNAPDVSALDVAPFPNATVTDLLIPARLSIFGDAFKASEFEYWGSHVPLVFILLAAVGLAFRHRAHGRSGSAPVLIMAAVTALLTLNPGGIPLDLVRKLPMGAGFRVAARFLPFFYFFALVAAAVGIEHVLSLRGRWVRVASLVILAVLGWIELYPARMSPSLVRSFPMPAQIKNDGVHGAFTLILPRERYTNVLDTYQVSMQVPVVHLSYLAREGPQTIDERRKRFPDLYSSPRRITARLLEQMRQANVRYVLFEDKGQYLRSKLRGTPVVERDNAVLVRYD